MLNQKAVSAHFTSEQLLHLYFAQQSNVYMSKYTAIMEQSGQDGQEACILMTLISMDVGQRLDPRRSAYNYSAGIYSVVSS